MGYMYWRCEKHGTVNRYDEMCSADEECGGSV